MMDQTADQLSDEELLSIADDPALRAKLSPQEMGRLSQLRATASNESMGGPVGRFVEGAVGPIAQAPGMLATVGQSLLPTKGGAEARQELGRSIVDPSVDRMQRAAQAWREGRPLAAIGNAAAAVPIIGPAVAHGVEQMQSGDVAGGAGTLTGIAAPFAVGPAVRGAGAALKGTSAGEAIADMADASANRRMVDQIVPKVGPNKVRLGNKAAEIAPKLLRDPELSAYSRGGLAEKISRRLDEATEGLDTAADGRLVSQQVKTGALLKAIDASINDLTASPVEGSQVGPTFKGGAPRDVPVGQSVEPAPNAAQLATLRQIRKEVAALGETAPYESVRKIRQAWDQVAKVKYSPAMSQDFLAKQGEATGASKGTGAMRESLAAADPASAKSYETYSLYKTADDVVQAAEEANRVRPNRGRGIMARTAGAVVGGREGGAVGAGIGAIVAGIADKAAEMAPTFQIAIARRLAAVADALRAGNPVEAQQILDRTIAKFPAVKTGLKITGKMTPAMDVARLPRAASNDPNEHP